MNRRNVPRGRTISATCVRRTDGRFAARIPRVRRTRGGKLFTGTAAKESKFFDTNVGVALTGTLAFITGAPATLNSVPQGDTQSSRIGNRIVVTKVMGCGHFLCVGDMTITGADEMSNVARLIVLVDHQANGALPAAADIITVMTAVNTF